MTVPDDLGRPELEKMGLAAVKARIAQLGPKNKWVREAQPWVDSKEAMARAADRAEAIAIAREGSNANKAAAAAADQANEIAEQALVVARQSAAAAVRSAEASARSSWFAVLAVLVTVVLAAVGYWKNS